MVTYKTFRSDGSVEMHDCLLARGWWYIVVEDGEASAPRGPFRTEADAEARAKGGAA